MNARKSSGKSKKKSDAGSGGGSAGNGSRLLIVESPAKARTLSRYLGDDYLIKASVGHIRDLPKRDLGVDVEHGFRPHYVTIRGKGKVVKELQQAAKGKDEILLATDPDREGEAIAYHVAEQLGYPDPDGRFRRVLFEEITREGVERGLANPGEIDLRKVEAQQARRILDRLVGYKVSPFLWKPIRPGLSAGRVQTVALRLIWEREEEIRRFEPEEYWTVEARLRKDESEFTARLHHLDGEKPHLPDEEAATAVVEAVGDRPFRVTRVQRKERRRYPYAPFTTSTLQQEASKRLRFSAKRTMRIAQQLYEGIEVQGDAAGLITYMRTDSTRVARSAVESARAHVKRQYGDVYLPKSGKLYGGKQQKAAQEAHEAIRPTSVGRTPESLQGDLDPDQLKLYRLIWSRFVASQMSPAVYDTTTVDFEITGSDDREYVFRVTGSVLKFDGFLRLYRGKAGDGKGGRSADDQEELPPLSEADEPELVELLKNQHFTEPPARYSEASLVKELEQQGIGRPSTYAQIISTLLDRKYVELDRRRFVATPLGETVAQVLIRVFPDIFDVDFTSQMEGNLDRIEEGEADWQEILGEFYAPFTRQLREGEARSDEIVREVVQAEDAVCDQCGRPMLVRWNRYGRFLGCSGYPECRNTRPIDEPPEVDLENEECPRCAGELVVKTGRYGPFVACSNYPDCRFTRPIDQKQAPAPTESTCPECGSEMVVKTGRYGEFLACTAYPECKHTQPITLGLACPDCEEGEIVKRRTRRGRTFYGCSRYPDCEWSSWDTPVEASCPECDASIAFEKSTKRKGDYLKCVSCGHEFTGQTSETAEAPSG